MAVKVPGNWFVWIYGSDTRKGTVAENNTGEVPLTAFSGIVSGEPTAPDWLQIEIYSMYPADVADRSVQRRAGGVHVLQGAGQWGGEMNILEYDFNESLDEYFAMLSFLRKPFTYIWFNDYDAGPNLMTDPVDSAMRIVFTSVPAPERDDAYIDVAADWVKYTEGI